MIIFQLECSPKLTYATAPTVLQESKQKKSKTNAACVHFRPWCFGPSKQVWSSLISYSNPFSGKGAEWMLQETQEPHQLFDGQGVGIMLRHLCEPNSRNRHQQTEHYQYKNKTLEIISRWNQGSHGCTSSFTRNMHTFKGIRRHNTKYWK